MRSAARRTSIINQTGAAHLALILLLLFGVIITLVFLRIQQSSERDRTSRVSTTTKKQMKGFSFSPKSSGSGDFTEFFAKAQKAGDAVTWAGPWRDLKKNAPVSIMGQAKKHSLVPVIAVGVYNQGADNLYESLDQSNRNELVQIAEEFAKEHQPPFFVIGVETNILFEKRPAEFDSFVQLYNSTYDAVKGVSPQTQVFTAFQLEKLAGLKGGLYGGANDPSQNNWQLLQRFEKSDLVGLTTYPGLVYSSPAEIPAGHYTAITSKTNKPLAFLEVGWHAEDQGLQAYAGSEIKQAEFTRRFFELIRGTDTRLAVWSFLYDQNFPVPFKGSGLITSTGHERPAYQDWLDAKFE